MLFRASNALGYSNYPDNVVKTFVEESAAAGMDLFRIFDSLNWVPNMRVAIEAVVEVGALCEAAICYTGDILDEQRTKYDLKYYVELAKELEKAGAHLLAIKDMAGLCKPYAAEKLIKTLKGEIGIPIHFHTHDTSGVQAATVIKAAETDVDIVDLALASFSGLTSQPNLNSVVESLRFTPRDTQLDFDSLQKLDQYWQAVRQFYSPFETGMMASTADVYQNEIPGGQYTNLFEQAKAIGLAHRWPEICRMYAECNQLLGDIVKVTPSSKAVGDMALFLITSNLTAADVLESKRELAFPESVVDLVSGRMGQPPGGFPAKIRQRVLRGQKPLRGRPGASLPAADFKQAAGELEAKLGRKPKRREVLSYLMFPKVTSEFVAHQKKFSDTSVLPTPLFFYGQQPGEEVSVEIETGQNADHQVSGRGRSPSRRPADGLLRAQRPAAQHQREGCRPGRDRANPGQGRPGRHGPGRCADARHGGHRFGQRGRRGRLGPEAVHARSHEDGNDDLRRARGTRGRRPRPARHAGRLGRFVAGDWNSRLEA